MSPASGVEGAQENVNEGSTANSGAPPEEMNGRRRKFRVSSKFVLPSERVAWAKHLPLLSNAAIRSGFGKEPVYSEVIEEGVGTQAGQLNVAFFVEAGLMDKKGRQYMPTDPCLKFVKLLSLDETRARQALRDVIEKTWFAQMAANYLSLKGKTLADDLLKELAIMSEVSNFDAKKAAFRVLLEYLSYTGIVVRDGDQVTLGQGVRPGMAPASDPVTAVLESPEPPMVMAAPSPTAPGAPVPVSAGPIRPSIAAPTMGPVAGAAEWVGRTWPGSYELWIKPTPKAVKLLKRVVEELEDAVKDEAQDGTP